MRRLSLRLWTRRSAMSEKAQTTTDLARHTVEELHALERIARKRIDLIDAERRRILDEISRREHA